MDKRILCTSIYLNMYASYTLSALVSQIKYYDSSSCNQKSTVVSVNGTVSGFSYILLIFLQKQLLFAALSSITVTLFLYDTFYPCVCAGFLFYLRMVTVTRQCTYTITRYVICRNVLPMWSSIFFSFFLRIRHACLHGHECMC